MNLDRAVDIVNDPALNAYCDFVHATVFRQLGEFVEGIDPRYDTVAYAFAYVAVEMALDDELTEVVADDETAWWSDAT